MILDTNAYSALERAVPSIVEAVRGQAELQLPLPVIAELRYGFRKGDKAVRNEQMLQRFLAQPQVSILSPTMQTTEKYAELRFLCQRRGRALSQNDIWIAALAHSAGGTLVTYDQDFTVFTELFGDKLLVLS